MKEQNAFSRKETGSTSGHKEARKKLTDETVEKIGTIFAATLRDAQPSYKLHPDAVNY